MDHDVSEMDQSMHVPILNASSAAVRLHDCKWCIMLLLSRSPNGCALVR